jgi:hypothetical protein
MTDRTDETKEARALACPHCDRTALATVHGIAIWDGWDKIADDSISDPTEYALVQCSQCSQVSVQARQDFGGGFYEDSPSVVYPAPRELNWNIPLSLRGDFEEAQVCFTAKAYKATAVMVRRVLEGTCKENSVKERNLAESLKKLEEIGLIDPTIAQWAKELRLLGNEGAHYTSKPVSRADAEDALSFAEALLDHIYVLRKRFDEFTQRRKNDQQSQPKSG